MNRPSLRAALIAALLVTPLADAGTALPTAAASEGTALSHVLIEAYGDSTTLGVSCLDRHCAPQPGNAVNYLRDALRAEYGDRVSVVNLGVGGTMAWQLRDGTDRARGLPWPDRLKASAAQIVTLNYGINEVMRGQTPQQFYEAETALVKTALAMGKVPVLATSNPMPDARFDARLAGMVKMTRRVAAEQRVPLVDQYAYVSGLSDWKQSMSDGAHPLPALYRLKARQDFDVLDPIVRRLLADASSRISALISAAITS
jgi:acyl-CoA thioesterase I